MPTSKKKASSRKVPTISAEGGIPKITLDMPLDEKQVESIKRCLAKGKLTITISRVDLAAGRLGEAWKYD
jgi:hypothetical protein